MMGIYRKKPVEVEAVRFDGCEWEDEDSFRPMFEGSFDIRPEWLTNAMAKPVRPGAVFPTDVGTNSLTIVTLEGEITASPGDYVIRGTAGEIYPCKPHIFAESYDGPIVVGRTELGK